MRGEFLESPSAMALSNSDSAENTETAYGLLAAEMRHLGINWDYASVVDIT